MPPLPQESGGIRYRSEVIAERDAEIRALRFEVAELESEVAELKDELSDAVNFRPELDWRIDEYDRLVELIEDVQRGVFAFADVVRRLRT